MNQGDNLSSAIKNMIKTSLDSYNKILPSTEINIEELMRKTEEINSKLNPKRPKEALKGQMSINEKSAEIEKKLPEINYDVDVDSFRMIDSKYVPRLRINHSQEKDDKMKEKDLANMPFGGIMSLCSFKEFHPKANLMKSDEGDSSYRIAKEEGRDPKKKREYSLNQLFSSNQYLQFTYHDEGEKLFDDNDLLRNAFEKNMQKNLLKSLNLSKKDSPFLQLYDEMLKKQSQMEEMDKQSKALCYQSQDEDKVKYEVDKDFAERNRQSGVIKGDCLMNSFQTYFTDQAKQYQLKKNPFIKEQCTSQIKAIQYSYEDIAFGCSIEAGLISYPSRVKLKESEVFLIKLSGPYLEIYDKEDSNEVDVSFDLRSEEKVLDSLLSHPVPHKLNGEIIINENGSRNGISSLLLFKQIASFYNSLKSNISPPALYNAMKFISDASIDHLDLISNDQFNVLQWHNNLISLTIRYDLLGKLVNEDEKCKWDIPVTLETLTVIKEDLNDDSNYEEAFYGLLSKDSSIHIKNIHLIQIDYSDTIHLALLKHIELFYSAKASKRQNDSIPLLNLSIKKSKEMISRSYNYQHDTCKVKEKEVNLNKLYCVFMSMLSHMLESNELFPLAFNKLDLANQLCSNVEGLVKIITKFKMIKEIDITDAKLITGEYIIDSTSFLPLIRIRSIDHGEVKLNVSDYEAELKNELKTMKEKNYLIDKDCNDLGYDLSFGVFPILERITFDHTSHAPETIQQLYFLFKRLKFFQGFSIPSAKDKRIDEETIANVIKEDIGAYCENIFKLEQDYKNSH